MKEYANELKNAAFELYMKLKKDQNLNKIIISHYPEKEERLKVLLWNFIKLKFKYAVIKKLDYDFSEILDLEDFYDEVYEMWFLKYKHHKVKCET